MCYCRKGRRRGGNRTRRCVMARGRCLRDVQRGAAVHGRVDVSVFGCGGQIGGEDAYHSSHAQPFGELASSPGCSVTSKHPAGADGCPCAPMREIIYRDRGVFSQIWGALGYICRRMDFLLDILEATPLLNGDYLECLYCRNEADRLREDFYASFATSMAICMFVDWRRNCCWSKCRHSCRSRQVACRCFASAQRIRKLAQRG